MFDKWQLCLVAFFSLFSPSVYKYQSGLLTCCVASVYTDSLTLSTSVKVKLLDEKKGKQEVAQSVREKEREMQRKLKW